MDSRTFNEWLKVFGYKWKEDETMVKGYMSESQALALAGDYLNRGILVDGR
jgi:hypothetical protein